MKNVKILFTDDAKECKADSGVEILVALAKEIDTIDSKKKTSDADLVRFGNLLAIKYGLSNRPCRNFVVLIGVERPKLVYFKVYLPRPSYSRCLLKGILCLNDH